MAHSMKVKKLTCLLSITWLSQQFIYTQPTKLPPLASTIPLGLNVAPCDSLLGIQASKIALLEKLATMEFPQNKETTKIQWLVSTDQATRRHLEEVVPAAGLTFEQITIFSQAEIPAFDNEGNMLLSNKHTIVTAPNGNGGLYSALATYLPIMKSRGVKYFHVYCVDNILCKVADPHFIGFFIEKQADVATKTVLKKPGELVGSVCMDNGRPRVTEYSELGSELAEQKASDGRLVFRAGSIANHLFSLDFLESFCDDHFDLPYHRALKKINYVSSNGALVKPTSPNGIKLEQFVFDVFERSSVNFICVQTILDHRNFYIWEVVREDEFSPLKNDDSVGKECLSSCKRDLALLNKKWLTAAGAKVEVEPIYLNTFLSYCGEGLDRFKGQTISGPLLN
ncbi:UTP--glucose-1-phosphate uridylyltransferase [Dictyocaulus viviparus]|uniref:UDP-N-acetylglucosamine diphosphorylase n=1 Tax=Dictyocaulus viviparus TaxID=29172 RepID=A0A0D8Y1L8_DICVI|nr:UTP--glucose-1-phosphate uridylyltransferase [Dictyocaulus viviparus]